jgi:Arc/MetJ-type ribon-helix-helix transcriptional regulator
MTPPPTELETAGRDAASLGATFDLPLREHARGTAEAVSDGPDPGAVVGQHIPPTRRRDATTGGPVLSVRVSRAEAKALDQVLRAAGYRSRSEALRALVRGAGGSVAPLPQETELLAELAHELHKIGVNVNQIALAANRRQIALMRAEWAAISALRKLLPDLRLAIGRLVDRRRQAGADALGSSGTRSGSFPAGPLGTADAGGFAVTGKEAARG